MALWFCGTFYLKICTCIDFSYKQLSTTGYSAAPKSLSCLEKQKTKKVLLQMLRPIHQKLRICHAATATAGWSGRDRSEGGQPRRRDSNWDSRAPWPVWQRGLTVAVTSRRIRARARPQQLFGHRNVFFYMVIILVLHWFNSRLWPAPHRSRRPAPWRRRPVVTSAAAVPPRAAAPAPRCARPPPPTTAVAEHQQHLEEQQAVLGGQARGLLEALGGLREVRPRVRSHCRFRNRGTEYVAKLK